MKCLYRCIVPLLCAGMILTGDACRKPDAAMLSGHPHAAAGNKVGALRLISRSVTTRDNKEEDVAYTYNTQRRLIRSDIKYKTDGKLVNTVSYHYGYNNSGLLAYRTSKTSDSIHFYYDTQGRLSRMSSIIIPGNVWLQFETNYYYKGDSLAETTYATLFPLGGILLSYTVLARNQYVFNASHQLTEIRLREVFDRRTKPAGWFPDSSYTPVIVQTGNDQYPNILSGFNLDKPAFLNNLFYNDRHLSQMPVVPQHNVTSDNAYRHVYTYDQYNQVKEMKSYGITDNWLYSSTTFEYKVIQ
ncbi:hypothetical protein [Chitinophaga nivalis]|uniref:DUF4595 domain-containing protein n=1 Tax=Chitinophaga nivalis TaxID=2991709 RepID=A0ABT3IKH7_9BACT|nr:hypothetical protein [Chitinophaga nivalis]MCW3465842.1 hypothetical protein [Chitinophaga nivalis]MCW3484467.1 hypothetical protein [Chitinophaga nivalis]